MRLPNSTSPRSLFSHTQSSDGTPNGVTPATPDNDLLLVTAQELERKGILRKVTAYRMAAEGKLPYYSVGCRGRGIRFRIEEVLAALRRPASGAVPK